MEFIKDFGKWTGSRWNWEITLRRPLFDWELDHWSCFISFLDCVTVRPLVENIIAWSFNINGLFSVSFFRKCLEEEANVNSMESEPIWQGIYPPKIEVFVWKLVKGRVMVKDVIRCCFGYSPLSVVSPLCNADDETVDHLFLNCRWS